MKRILVLTLLFFLVLSATAFAELASLEVGKGAMQIGVVFQPKFTFYIGDEQLAWDDTVKGLRAVDRASDMEFAIHRARVILSGEAVERHVYYMLQIDFAGKLAFASDKKYLTDATLDMAAFPGSTTYTETPPDEVATGMSTTQETVSTSGYAPQFLDLKLSFKFIPYTTVSIGRWLPNFTYFIPQSTGKLILVDYPLMDEFMGAQRQTGMDIEVNTKYVDVNVGVWNGRFYKFLNPDIATDATLDSRGQLIPGSAPGITEATAGTFPIFGPAPKAVGNTTYNFGDENTAKDLSAKLVVKPIDELAIWVDGWYGMPLDYKEYDKGDYVDHNDNVILTTGGVAYRPDFGLTLITEFFYGKMMWDRQKYSAPTVYGDAQDDHWYDRPADFRDVEAMSFYGMAGFNFNSVAGVPIELLVRYDWLDPDTSNKKYTFTTGATSTDPTGVTYTLDTSLDTVTYITGGFNYYIQDWVMLYLNYIHKDETAKYYVKDKAKSDTQYGLNDDEIKLMMQVCF